MAFKILRYSGFLLIIFVIAFSAWLISKTNTSEVHIKDTIPVNFFIPERFWDGVKKAGIGKNNKNVGKIQVALVPHHLLAGQLISGIFEKLKKQDIKTLIVIGPNHYEKGGTNLQYANFNWQTEFGVVEGAAFNAKKNPNTASEQTMTDEHSIAGLMPYVKYYLPKAKAFSVIVKHNTSDEELSTLAGRIIENWNDKTAALVSVDFSHYLPTPIANQKDELTRRILLEQNEWRLYDLNNDYMDSPASAAVMLKICKKLKVQNFIINEHSNSALILNNPDLQSTTSYFTGYCPI